MPSEMLPIAIKIEPWPRVDGYLKSSDELGVRTTCESWTRQEMEGLTSIPALVNAFGRVRKVQLHYLHHKNIA